MNRLSRSVLPLFIAILPLAAAADQLIGTPSGGGNTYQWTNIQIQSYDKITLRIVTPAENVVLKSFNYGSPLTINVSELPGSPVPSGEYTWELRVIPVVSVSVRQQLQQARASGNEAQARQIMIENGLYDTPVQSGSFRIANGSIVSTSGTEEDANDGRFGTPSTNAAFRDFEPRADDEVILDDLIVEGSACIGFDCVNGESFSFDTLRLKENNLRVHFDDTSTIAGFPANDWRIIANSSAAGGGSHFAVEDSTGLKTPLKIESGAATNSLYADSTGSIGFRTATPVLDLHVTTSNTPAIRFEQTSAGGFTAQTWDIGSNEQNFFVRDVTDGSKLPFRIRPGAPTSSLDISADGDVGIGTASPKSKLDVYGVNVHVLVGDGTTDFLGATQTGYGADNGAERLFFGVQAGLAFLGSNTTPTSAWSPTTPPKSRSPRPAASAWARPLPRRSSTSTAATSASPAAASSTTARR